MRLRKIKGEYTIETCCREEQEELDALIGTDKWATVSVTHEDLVEGGDHSTTSEHSPYTVLSTAAIAQ